MLIRNEQAQLVEAADYANEILNEGLGDENVTEQDAHDALAELFVLSEQDSPSLSFITGGYKAALAPLTTAAIDKGGLWETLKRTFCDLIKENGLLEKAVDYILEAISIVIRLGKLIKPFVKRIVKYFLNLGFGKVCA